MDITVKINDQFSGTLEKLRQQLESIDDDILEVLVKILDSDVEELKAELESIDGTVTEGTHITKYEEIGDRPPPDFVASNEQSRKFNGDFGPKGVLEAFDESKHPAKGISGLPVLHETQKTIDRQRSGSISRVTNAGNFPGPSIGEKFWKRFGKDGPGKQLKVPGGGIKNIEGRLKKLMPTMRRWMNLIAALIPMLISWATAALGVASAMAAVAGAGAAMVGLGLLGFDDMGERLDEFREDLKSVFEPVANAFQPITESTLTELPMMLSDVAQELRGLTAFRDTFDRMLQTLVDAVSGLISGMKQLEPIMSQLTDRFLDMTLSGIGEFFAWLVEEAFRNQDALIGLTKVLVQVLATVYNLSTAVSEVVLEFKPLFGILMSISELLNHDLITGMVATLGKMYLMIKVVRTAVLAWNALTAAMAKNPLGLIGIGAAIGASELLGITNTSDNGFGNGGPGGASGPGMGTSRRGGDTYYTMNVEGNVTDKQVQRFKDIEAGHRTVESKDRKRKRGE